MLNFKALREAVRTSILPARSVSEVSTLALMFFLAGVTFGATGLGAMLLMTLLSSSHLGKDASAKHGISNTESSRLGGLAVSIVVIIYIAGLSAISPYTPGIFRGNHYLYFWSAIFCCCALGFAEDIKPNFLTPKLRLGAKFALFGALFWVSPIFIPLSIGIFAIDFLLNIPILG